MRLAVFSSFVAAIVRAVARGPLAAARPRGGAPPTPAPDNILLADNGDFFTDDAGNLLENA